MALAQGAPSFSNVTDTSQLVTWPAATGAVGALTYNLYRSTVTGFVPGPGNIISTGQVSTSFQDSGLIPGTTYYYVVRAIDAGDGTADSPQATGPTVPQLQQPNAFAQSPQIGEVDMRYNTNTVSAQVDASQVGSLFPGQAVKIVDNAGGIPKVVACTANSDQVWGFINFDIKSTGFVAGDRIEVSRKNNIMYLVSTGPISRGVQVQLDLSSIGGVAQINGGSGANLVGESFDKAPAAGTIMRVQLRTSSFQFA